MKYEEFVIVASGDSIERVPKVVRVQLKCPCGCSLAKIAFIKIHKGGVAMKVLRGIMFAALSLFSLLVVNTSGVQGAEPEPVTNPTDITGGDFPPEHYVVLPVPRGDLEAVKKNLFCTKMCWTITGTKSEPWKN